MTKVTKEELEAADLKRYVEFDKLTRKFVCAVYFDLGEDKRIIMAIKVNKQKALAVNQAMAAARERLARGEFESVETFDEDPK